MHAPKKLFSFVLPIANSSIFVFPRRTASCSHNFFVIVDSYGGMKLFRILLAAVVFIFSVQKASFTAIGIPHNVPAVFALIFASASFAIFSACSGVSVIYAFRCFCFCILSRYACVSSVAEVSPFFRALIASDIVNFVRFILFYGFWDCEEVIFGLWSVC